MGQILGSTCWSLHQFHFGPALYSGFRIDGTNLPSLVVYMDPLYKRHLRVPVRSSDGPCSLGFASPGSDV